MTITNNIEQLRTKVEQIQGLARLIDVTAEEKFVMDTVCTLKQSRYASAMQNAAIVIDSISHHAWSILETLENELEALPNASNISTALAEINKGEAA